MANILKMPQLDLLINSKYFVCLVLKNLVNSWIGSLLFVESSLILKLNGLRLFYDKVIQIPEEM